MLSRRKRKIPNIFAEFLDVNIPSYRREERQDPQCYGAQGPGRADGSHLGGLRGKKACQAHGFQHHIVIKFSFLIKVVFNNQLVTCLQAWPSNPVSWHQPNPAHLTKAAAEREGGCVKEMGPWHGSTSSAQLGLLREFKKSSGDVLGGEANFPGVSLGPQPSSALPRPPLQPQACLCSLSLSLILRFIILRVCVCGCPC